MVFIINSAPGAGKPTLLKELQREKKANETN